MKKNSFLITMAILIFATNLFAQVTSTFTDSRDGKAYKEVKIGTQIWMAQNLAYKETSGCLAYNNDEINVETYGYLYSWETAKNVCPSGWHLPNEAEWATLVTFLGGDTIAGGKLKETKTTHWKSPNTGATNKSGFTALPGGYLDENGKFLSLGDFGYWWTSSVNDNGACWYKYICYKYSELLSYSRNKNSGFSVRCVKDF